MEETGAEASFIDWILPLTIDQLKEVAGKTSMIIGSVPESAEEGRNVIIYKEPYGVILGIAPR
jgi:acyl-CoA reductase-like NAD-dependent aldehyde dehydrogenase